MFGLFLISVLHKNKVERNKAEIVIGIPVEFPELAV